MNGLIESSRCEWAAQITRGEYSWHSWLDTLVPGLQICWWCKQVRACPACWEDASRQVPIGAHLVRCFCHGGDTCDERRSVQRW
jgi:hypothetical protein